MCKLKIINEFISNKTAITLNEEVNQEEIELAVNFAIANNIQMIIEIDRYTEEEIGKIVKTIGVDINYLF